MSKEPNLNSGNDDELIAVTGLNETTLMDLGNARLMILNSLAKLESSFRYKKVREELGMNNYFTLTQAHNRLIALSSHIMPDISELVKRLYNFGDDLNKQATASMETDIVDEQIHTQTPSNDMNVAEQINSLMKGSMSYVQQQVDNLEEEEDDEESIKEQSCEETEEDQNRSEDQN